MEGLNQGALEFQIEALLVLLATIAALLLCSVGNALLGPQPDLPHDLSPENRRSAELQSSLAAFRRYLSAGVIGLVSGLVIVWYGVLGSAVEMLVAAGICVVVWFVLRAPGAGKWIWLVSAVAWLVAVTAHHVGSPAKSPQRVAREFLTKVKYGDCDAAWNYFSTEAQRAIEADAKRLQSQNRTPGWNDQLWTAHNLYCKPNGMHLFMEYDPRSVVVLSQTATSARIGVRRGEAAGFLIPGFFPTKTIWHDRQMGLVREGGQWKLDLPTRAGR